MKKIILILSLVLLCNPVYAACSGYKNNIEIEVIKDYGEIVFNDTLSSEEFGNYTGKLYNRYHDTMGLTVASFNMSVESTGTQVYYPDSDFACVYLDKVKLYLSYDDIYVLIDKKYKKGSCQYNVILKHEKKHVAVHKKSLDYYTPYIREALIKAAKEMEPRVMTNDENVEDVLSLLSSDLMDSVAETLDFFEEERIRANAELDTEENYEKERQQCDSW